LPILNWHHGVCHSPHSNNGDKLWEDTIHDDSLGELAPQRQYGWKGAYYVPNTPMPLEQYPGAWRAYERRECGLLELHPLPEDAHGRWQAPDAPKPSADGAQEVYRLQTRTDGAFCLK
jgi:hypothetical protein